MPSKKTRNRKNKPEQTWNKPKKRRRTSKIIILQMRQKAKTKIFKKTLEPPKRLKKYQIKKNSKITTFKKGSTN